MTEQTPEPTPAAAEPAKPAPTQTPPPEGDGKGGKDAILADLARERDRRQALEQQFNDLRGGLAKAFGLQDGEKPEPDALAQKVNTLQERLDAAERHSRLLDVAAEHDIPKNYQHLLTATDDETLRAQATAVSELVKGKTPGTPAPDPSQGAQPTSAEAAAAAEYEQFYPSTRK